MSWLDTFKAIWFFLDKDKSTYVFWNSVLFICNYYRLLPPIIIGLIVDFFTEYSGGSLQPFYNYVLFLAGSYALFSWVRLHAKGVLADVGIDVRYKARVRSFEQLLIRSVTWHEKENSGNKVQRVETGSESMKRWFWLTVNEYIPAVTYFTGVIIIFLFLDVQFVVFLLVYTVLFFFTEYLFNKKYAYYTELYNKAKEAASGTYYESTSNILSVKTHSMKDSVFSHVSKHELEAREIDSKRKNIGIAKWMTFQTINAIGLGAFVYLAGAQFLAGSLTIGFIVVYFNYYEQLRRTCADITRIITDAIDARSAILRMMTIFEEDDEKFFGEGVFPKNWKEIVMKDVGFSYGKTRSVDKFTFTLRRGEKVGIAGKSGGGKTTLVKLLLGVYKVDSGSISVDGKDFYSFTHESIVKHMSVVLQESELFNVSLKDNISLLHNDEKRFKKAVEIAQLKPVIEKMPEGVNTLIGEKGYRLSGGERQRLGVARALHKNADILILDEATSALDSKTEKAVQAELEKLHKTMIIIAHRLSTLRHVDRIIVFEEGRIVEEGSFSSLVRKKGVFYQLYELQKRSAFRNRP